MSNQFSKAAKWLVAGTFVLLISGCSSVNVNEYAGSKPEFKLFDFFAGKTYAWGQFQDRSGKVIRRFKVDITGTISKEDNKKLTLDEKFIYDNGEKQERIWKITETSPNHYIGFAGDVIGKATGQSAGNALNWHYVLDLPYKDSTIHVKLDDWMYMQSEHTMINRSEVTKFGFRVGEITLFFSKKPIED
ncbi:DUF3833 domain-containing protein [Thiomicrorhabdus sp.]|uniref:DUF3833 domain-containing protein n=1 Tax=Thiomicrorhabdus sp. TaxID=2039724 RepID=UPI002AA69C32|nr:DUF3833 domain-containing protein [Thiomicrorhabdus sp.]